MTIEVINTGVAPNDQTGDPIRTAFEKCNNNFLQLDAAVISGSFGSFDIGGNIVQANSPGSILTLVNGLGIAITGNNATDTVTITNSGVRNFSITGSGMQINAQTGNVNLTLNSDINPVANTVVIRDINGNIYGNLISSNTISGTLTTASQPNITAVGNLSALYVNGNTEVVGNTRLNLVTGNRFETGNVVPGTHNIFNLGNSSSRYAQLYLGPTGITLGNIIIRETANSSLTFYQNDGETPAIISSQSLTAGATIADGGSSVTVGATGNITMTVASAEKVRVIGDGVVVSGNLSATNITGTLTAGPQPFITSIGALTNITASGNASFGNISGTIVTNLQPNITTVGTLGNLAVSGNITVGNISASGLYYGRLATPYQPLITELGPLLSLNVVGNALVGNNLTVTGNLTVNGSTTTINSTTLTVDDLNIVLAQGAVDAAAAEGAGITVEGANAQFTYASAADKWISNKNLEVTGNVTALTFLGSAAGLANIPAANITGTLAVNTTGSATKLTTSRNINGVAFDGTSDITVTANASTLSGTALNTTITGSSLTSLGTLVSLTVSGNITAGNVSATAINGTLATAAQPNITQLGTLSTLAVTGNIAAGNVSVANGTVTLGNILNGNGNGVGNIGNTSNYFNTVFAKATSAQYADLAEKYLADRVLSPGTVVVFGGTDEITISTQPHDTRVAGVVSTQPAYIMNSTLNQGTTVALLGRVPCQVVGRIFKGDLLVQSYIPGVATNLNPACYSPGCVIGKALEDFNDVIPGIIEIAVGRL